MIVTDFASRSNRKGTLLCFYHLGMADRGSSLRSQQWSCSELVRGAELCADMAGLALAIEPGKLTREQLLQSIEDISKTLGGSGHGRCRI